MSINKKRLGKTIVLITLLVLPTFLFYFFIYAGVHNVNRLPFYGPVRIVDTTYHGKSKKDTVYFEIPPMQLVTVDSEQFNPIQLERNIYIAHFLDFDQLDSIPNQIIYTAAQIFEKHDDVYFVTFLENYHGQSVPQPSSYTPLLEGRDSSWIFVIVPKEQLDSIRKNGYFVKDPEMEKEPDPYSMVMVDKERRIRGYYNPTWVSDIKRLKSEIEYLKKEYLLNYRTHRYYEYDDKIEQKKLKNKKK